MKKFNDADAERRKETWRSWLVLLACFLIITMNSGILLAQMAVHYVYLVHTYDVHTGTVGWSLATALLLLHLMGILINALVEKYGCRPVTMVGSLIASTGMACSSFMTSYIGFFFLYGVVAGVGGGTLHYVASLAPQLHFTKWRAVAGGIAIAGFSTGTLVFAVTTELLHQMYGWRGTVLINSAIWLHAIPLSFTFLPVQATKKTGKEKEKNEKLTSCLRPFIKWGKKSFDFTLLANKSVALYIVGASLQCASVYLVNAHLTNRARYAGLSSSQAALVTSFLGLGGIVARFITPWPVAFFKLNLVIICSVAGLASSLTSYLMTLANTYFSCAIGATVYGFTAGCFVCLMVTALRDIAGLDKTPRATSLLLAAIGIFTLVMVPFAGWLYDVTGDYDLCFIVGGCIQATGSCLQLLVYVLQKCSSSRSYSPAVIVTVTKTLSELENAVT